MDMTKDKIEVGSKWVAKIDNPQGAGILTGAVVRVIEVDGIETIYYDYGDDLPAYAASILWYDYFKPYVEEPLLNLGYFDYPDIDDTGNIVDNVNSPSHYGQGKIEAIEYISDFLTKEEYQGYLRGNKTYETNCEEDIQEGSSGNSSAMVILYRRGKRC